MARVWRLATRASALAVAQSQTVADAFAAHTGDRVELLQLTTKGDQVRDRPLSQVGGKGLFTKEIEEALLTGAADLAVHSMKDLPTDNPPGLVVAAVPAREDARDALVGATLEALAHGAVVGTGSARRKAQLLARRSDLRVRGLRGNVGTRVRKQQEGSYDAVVLACAGLRRLGRAADIAMSCDVAWMVPAVGQGALAVQCRLDDSAAMAALTALNHADTALAVQCERAYLRRLEGGCSVPAACYAVREGDALRVRAFYAVDDLSSWAHLTDIGPVDQAEAIGVRLADAVRAAAVA